jgi:hypothetical protein
VAARFALATGYPQAAPPAREHLPDSFIIGRRMQDCRAPRKFSPLTRLEDLLFG